jgi:homocysteine S-methyltransferase
MINDPLKPFLSQQGVVIVDGGLATELEARGYDLRDKLWSARLLTDAPKAIREVHLSYLSAGADIIISASYQATIPAFMTRGLGVHEAEALVQRSVTLAQEARDAFWAVADNRVGRLRPLVAASVGPYGAFLADGSEYRGDYGLSEEALMAFHRRRWHLLAACKPDLLACETIPSGEEARALGNLCAETTHLPVWMSFSCQDGERLHDGTAIENVTAALDDVAQIIAMGVNCTAPRFVAELVARIRKVTTKSIVVYPNSGEMYDAATGQWEGETDVGSFAQLSYAWRAEGAGLIGGCCRTGPRHIAQIRRHQVMNS